MKKKILTRLMTVSALAISAIAPSVGSLAFAQDANPELQPVETSEVQIKDVDPALWVVKDDDTTIYLFGTVHVLRPGLGWFDEEIKTAFDKSDQLVMEIIEPSPAEAQAVFGKYALAQDGKKMTDRLSGDDLESYKKAMKALGLPVAAFEPLDPWAAAITLQVMALTKSGYDPNSGAEKQLTAAAKASAKKLGEVETMEEQLQIFESVPVDSQVEFLKQTLSTLEDSAGELDMLVDAWGKGNVEELGQMMNAGFSDPKIYDKLLTQRNANWASWINKRLDKPGTIFMAVGAGHLAGTTSVQHMLTAYGIEAKRINY